MTHPDELFIVASIFFFAGGLLVYWLSRLIVLLGVAEVAWTRSRRQATRMGDAANSSG